MSGSSILPRRRGVQQTPSSKRQFSPRRKDSLVPLKRLVYTSHGRRQVVQFCCICILLVFVCLALLIVVPTRDPSFPYITRPQENIRTLVVGIGSVRGGEATWNSMYKHLLDVNNADLALVVGESSNKTASMYKRAKYLYEFPEYNDWADAIDLVNGTTWRKTIYPLVNVTPDPVSWSFFLGGAGIIGGSGAIHFMARFWAQELIKREGLLQKYDRFIVTRTDHYYLCKHDLTKLDNAYIWIPKHEDYFGICDRHVMANSSAIFDVLNVLPHLINHADEYNPELERGQLKYKDPESFLRLYWEKRGILPSIRRFDRVQFTVKNSDDKTRGSVGVGRVVNEDIESLGLTIKYTPEFYSTECNCEHGLAYSSVNWQDQQRGWCLPGNSFTRNFFHVQ